MRFTIKGDQFDLDPESVISRLRGLTPEAIQKHWVDVNDTHYPVNQALEAVLGISRTRFTSKTARYQFDRLGFLTSTADFDQTLADSSLAGDADHPDVTVEDAGAAFATLVAFLRGAPFTAGIGQLEHALVNADSTTAAQTTAAAGLTEQLLEAALIVRRNVGRVSDVIHATVISLALPVILEAGEFVSNRPSLGPGNDKTRPFDLETNVRVAEFKVAVWSGGDMMRKRGVTADLVHLALDDSGRRPELWVAGEGPLRFIRTSTSPVSNLPSRSSRHLRAKYEAAYGTDAIPLRDFAATHAARVRLHNLADALPAVAAALV